MNIMATKGVILLIIIIKMAIAKIWADPSRAVNTTNAVEAMMSHKVYIRNIETFSTTMSEYKILLPFSTRVYEDAFKNIDLGLMNMLFQYKKYFKQSSWPEKQYLNNTSAALAPGYWDNLSRPEN